MFIQVAVEKEEVDEMVAPLLPAVALAGVDLNQLNTNHLNDMKELYTILDVTNLAVKTKLKTHIKRVQKDFAQWLEGLNDVNSLFLFEFIFAL
jgi:hypothetical protein